MIAAFIRKLGQKIEASELVSRESYVEPFNMYLYTLGATKKRSYAWQVKVVDICRVIETMQPVFEERIKTSPLRGYSGTISINLYGVTVTLAFDDGIVRSIEQSVSEPEGDVLVNPRIFLKMLLGYRSIDELEEEYLDVRIKSQYVPMMSILFPRGDAHIHTCY